MRAEMAIGIVRDRLAGVPPRGARLGSPQVARNLTLVPLFTNGDHADYTLFSVTRHAGTAEVTEAGPAGKVPTLKAKNAGTIPILMIEGETLIGLKQNRMLNTSIMVPPESELNVPVACVEAHRWSRMTAKAGLSRYSISPGVRAAKMRSLGLSLRSDGEYATDQALIWGKVASTLSSHRVKSPTSAYSDIEEQRRDDIDRLLAQLKPAPGQTGVLAFIGNEPLSLDLFDQATTLYSTWNELIGSYVSDALVSDTANGTVTADQAERWLRSLSDGEATVHRGVGLGETVLITGDRHTVTALVVDGVPVHVAAWPRDE